MQGLRRWFAARSALVKIALVLAAAWVCWDLLRGLFANSFKVFRASLAVLVRTEARTTAGVRARPRHGGGRKRPRLRRHGHGEQGG